MKHSTADTWQISKQRIMFKVTIRRAMLLACLKYKITALKLRQLKLLIKSTLNQLLAAPVCSVSWMYRRLSLDYFDTEGNLKT